MLTLENLFELDAMVAKLATMVVRVADFRETAQPELVTDPWFRVAQRLSKVESAFYVLDTILEDTCAEIRAARAATETCGNVVQLRPEG